MPKVRPRWPCIGSGSARAPARSRRLRPIRAARLLAELDKPGIGRIVDPELMSAARASTAAFNFREERQARLVAQKQAEEERKAAMENGMEQTPDNAARANPDPLPDVPTADLLQGSEGALRRGAAVPRSASSSGWSGSGRTISASRPT